MRTDFSGIPFGLGPTLGSIAQSPLLLFFLGAILLVFISAIIGSLHAATIRVEHIRTITRDVDRLAGKGIDEVRTALQGGDLGERFERAGLRRAATALCATINGMVGSPDEGRAQTYLSLEVLQSMLNPRKVTGQLIPIWVRKASGNMVALGVIGTFLGLTIGVSGAGSGLASPDISLARAAMSDLLDGAKLAFLTSLFGLAGATFLGLVLMNVTTRLECAITDLEARLAYVLNARDSLSSVSAQAYQTNKNLSLILERISERSTEKKLDRICASVDIVSERLSKQLSVEDFQKALSELRHGEAIIGNIRECLIKILETNTAVHRAIKRLGEKQDKPFNQEENRPKDYSNFKGGAGTDG